MNEITLLRSSKVFFGKGMERNQVKAGGPLLDKAWGLTSGI